MTYFCRLNPPRATFMQDMTEEEKGLMQAHGVYWRDAMNRGHVVAFGVVGDPAGAFGIGIVEFSGPEEAQAFTDGDPVIKAGRGFRYDVLPMPFGAVHG